MRPPLRSLLWTLALVAAVPALAAAESPPLRALVEAAAAQARVAPALVSAIVWVESGGWPWTLNIRGTPVSPRTLEEARRILRRLPHEDVDIGLMQVNWRSWGPALRRLGLDRADLLDPWTNLVAGSHVLRWATQAESGWGGVGRYHSATPWRKHRYAWAVARTWQALDPLFRNIGIQDAR